MNSGPNNNDYFNESNINAHLFFYLKLLHIIDYERKYNNKFIVVIYENLVYIHETTEISLQSFLLIFSL